MKDLNLVASEYNPNSITALENDLILNWYPKQIIKRFCYVGSILELGLGHGLTANIFSKACSRYVVIEGSSVVINRFIGNNPRFKGKIVLDYFETYSPVEKFDVIIMGFILEHVDDPDTILGNYQRFLKSGGKVYITVPNAKSLNRRLGVELGKINDIYELNVNDISFGHQRQYCRDTLHDTLKRNGYHITHEEGIYLKPLPLDFLKKLPNFKDNLNAMMKVGIEFPDLCVGLLVEATPNS